MLTVLLPERLWALRLRRCNTLSPTNHSSLTEFARQNVEKENDIYKKVFRKEELQDFLKERNLKVNII